MSWPIGIPSTADLFCTTVADAPREPCARERVERVMPPEFDTHWKVKTLSQYRPSQLSTCFALLVEELSASKAPEDAVRIGLDH